ncbi:MAG: HAMP domain-containing sensor histidine kinase [Rhizomicrobium sp.]
MQIGFLARLNRFRQLAAYSLSGRLLLLTSLFVLACEILILAPVIGRVYRGLLDIHVLSAELAVMPFTEPEGQNLSFGMRRLLLNHADAMAVAVTRSDRRDFFTTMAADTMPSTPARRINLIHGGIGSDIYNAVECLSGRGDRVLYVVSRTRIDKAQEIGVLLNEGPIRATMLQFTRQYIVLSLIISGISAVLVFASLFFFLVRPMRRITQAMVSFRENPEDGERILIPRQVAGEIGTAERELAAMQRELYGFLHQRARLAALGASVARIQHDLRNILATAQLASDRLTTSQDPAVKKMAPSLIASIDRAVALASNTLKFSRTVESPPQKRAFFLQALASEAIETALSGGKGGPLQCDNKVPADFAVLADREQLYRILVNLVRNAVEALDGKGGWIVVSADHKDDSVLIDVADSGPGLPKAAVDKLFQPFASVAKPGGSGLGLAIARELMRGHGGDAVLVTTGPQGTRFRLILPAN